MPGAGEHPSYNIHDDISEILFTEKQIKDKISEMARQVAVDFYDKQPIIMPILKGGFTVAADLIRSLDPCPKGVTVEFVAASSYGAGTETSGKVEISFDKNAVKDRHILIVDDLCDSGLTLAEVHRQVQEAGAASIKSWVLLDKTERRKVHYVPDYVGYLCPNKWVVGNGMDTAQIYRALPYIGVLKPEVQARFM